MKKLLAYLWLGLIAVAVIAGFIYLLPESGFAVLFTILVIFTISATVFALGVVTDNL